MKILHIIQSLESGGAERTLSKLVNMDNENHHYIILLFESELHYKLSQNVTIINFSLENNLKSKIKILFMLSRYIKDIKPDIVQTWMNSNFYAPILKRKFKSIKFILNIRHGVTRKYRMFDNFLLKKYFSKVDGSIFVSKSSLKEFRNTKLIFPFQKVIQNGFEYKKYQYKDQFEKLNFIHVGRMHKVKNQKMLVSAFNKFCLDKDDVNLYLAGKNMEFNNFSDCIFDENKEKFKWFGEVENPFEVYKKGQVLILTSMSEGFPNVIGEAMSIGVPVITTDAGESFEIIGNSGFKIENSESSLIKTLNYIYINKEILIDKSKKAYEIVRNKYSIDGVVTEYTSMYKEMLKE